MLSNAEGHLAIARLACYIAKLTNIRSNRTTSRLVLDNLNAASLKMEWKNMPSSDKTFSDIMALVQRLRGENGCPWDQKQTPDTMAPYLIEETFELADAIAAGSPDDVREELGDVLFQLAFIANLYQEAGLFSIEDAMADVLKKMIRRHPHIFGNERAETPEDVKKQWHRIKGEEKKNQLPASIPKELPALMRAYRISDRIARTGVGEAKEAVRRCQVRFEAVEKAAAEAGTVLEDLAPAEKKRLWEAAKALGMSETT